MTPNCRYCGQNDWGKHSCNRCGAPPSDENLCSPSFRRNTVPLPYYVSASGGIVHTGEHNFTHMTGSQLMPRLEDMYKLVVINDGGKIKAMFK